MAYIAAKLYVTWEDMNTKLTLRLDEDVINRMKYFATSQNQSLSKFTENLFRQVLESDEEEAKKLSPIVRKYRGVLKNKIKDDKDELFEILSEKHGK